ncbi:MAG: DNA mismatch repair endonuclease MutL, partial [Intestinibacter sp.]|uniref:DNA mismatch repair endonuclease MutL n=1 Tax=Intestinibacter sp. TaxID=1965304 RepID=UPI002A83221C
VKDLFFNTPVRAKFLKSTHAETINISDLVNKLAIGNPAVRLKYINNSKLMLNTPGDDKLINVIRSIYGKDITENLIELNYEDDKIKIYGYIGNNNIYRSNKNLQHIYINNRYVKSKVILDAINESYKGIIPINKFAVCFLNIELNPNEIDVNIHPTKLEVKFQNEKDIYIAIRDIVKNKLLNISLIGKYKSYSENTPEINKQDENKSANVKNNVNEGYTEKKSNLLDVREKKEEYTVDERNDLSTFKSFKEALEQNEQEKNDYYSDKGYVEEKNYNVENLTFEQTNTEEKPPAPVEDDTLEKILDNSQSTSFRASDYKVIGTVLNTYIVLEKGTSMYLLDQHAAHEKILYEEYMNKFKHQNIDMQMLLDPIVLELSSVDMLDVEKNLNLFMKFGFEIEIFGNNHIMVRGVPNIFGVAQSEKFVFQIIDNIGDLESSYDLKLDKIASMACRAAIKANDKIHFEEIDSLLSKMEKCENPFTCPHGRPSIVEISKKEIEKMFKRIM